VKTDLFVFGDPAPVPPDCRRPPAPLPAWRVADADTAVIELPILVPRAPASHIIPVLSILSGGEYSFRFEARTSEDHGWTSLSPVGPNALSAVDPAGADHAGPVPEAPVGDAAERRVNLWAGGPGMIQPKPLVGDVAERRRALTTRASTSAEPASALTPEIDQYSVSPPAREVHLRVHVHCADLESVTRAPTLLTVSLSSEAPSSERRSAAASDASHDEHAPGAPHGVNEAWARGRSPLPVPAFSQMEAPEPLRHRICSPTSLAMVLGYWKRPVTPAELAADTYDPRHDLYGVWPAAIRAAARRGIQGYLLRFPSWAAATWCLDHGLPIIASVRYADGELRGAAIGSTKGHLLVLTGHDGDVVLANDPAAATAEAVPRRYALPDIQRVWLERSAVGYVLFDPAG